MVSYTLRSRSGWGGVKKDKVGEGGGDVRKGGSARGGCGGARARY